MSRRYRIGAETTPLIQNSTRSRSGAIVVTVLIALGTVAAIVLASIALGKVSDTTIDGSTIHDLKITGKLDLSMTDMILPPPWHEPIVRHGGRVVS